MCGCKRWGSHIGNWRCCAGGGHGGGTGRRVSRGCCGPLCAYCKCKPSAMWSSRPCVRAPQRSAQAVPTETPRSSNGQIWATLGALGRALTPSRASAFTSETVSPPNAHLLRLCRPCSRGPRGPPSPLPWTAHPLLVPCHGRPAARPLPGTQGLLHSNQHIDLMPHGNDQPAA